MDESSDALDAAVYTAALHRQINGGCMPSSIVGSMLGQNISSGQLGGIANSAAQQANNAAQQQAQWNAAQGMAGAQMPMYPKTMDVRVDRSRLEMHVKITQAENGFIVGISNAYGEILSPHIAATMEDVTTIITSQLASKMLDRTEQ